jgi:transposase
MWILAALRRRQFFSLPELNEAIAELLIKLNQRPFRKLRGSRAELYATIDRPALQPLPAQRFVFAEWKKTRINIDYHVELDGHYYRAPYQLVGKQVEVRFTSATVEILFPGKRVASHVRSRKPYAHTTLPEHRPKSHQQYLEWTPSRIVDWAAKTGPFTGRLVAAWLAEKPHPEMGYRSALGVISLSRKYGPERVEAACTRAVRMKVHRYQSVQSILASGLDQQPLPQLIVRPPVEHANIRGADYYGDGAQPAQGVGGC